MGLQNRVEALLETYTDLPEDVRKCVAKSVATCLGRAGGPEAYKVKAVAKKEGVYLGENMTTKLDATPTNRLFAACSQLDETIGKLSNSKGQYQMKSIQACIEVPEGLVKSLREQHNLVEPTAVEA